MDFELAFGAYLVLAGTLVFVLISLTMDLRTTTSPTLGLFIILGLLGLVLVSNLGLHAIIFFFLVL